MEGAIMSDIKPNQPEEGDEIIRVQDAARILEFPGRLLGDVSTETPDDPRWLEIELYKVTDGTERYVLHLVGRSVLYHRAGSVCKGGFPRKVSAADWPDDAEACRRCKPSDWRYASGDVSYDLEVDRHTTYVCQTPAEVVEQLKVGPRTRGKLPPGTLSGPAQGLLDIAAHNDEGIAAVTKTVERL